MESVTRILDGLSKTPPKLLIPLSILLLILLMAPSRFTDIFGTAWIENVRPYFGIVFFLSIILLSAQGIEFLENRRKSQKKLQRLHYLSKEEKQLLRDYLDDKTRTLAFIGGSRVASSLVNDKILTEGPLIREDSQTYILEY